MTIKLGIIKKAVTILAYALIALNGFAQDITPFLNDSTFSPRQKQLLLERLIGKEPILTADGTLTKYKIGKRINNNLFWMVDGENKMYLFKTGELDPIGIVDSEKSSGVSGLKPLIMLESGKVIDLDGAPVELIKYQNENVAIKNKKTGKYILVDNDGNIKGDQEYDKVIANYEFHDGNTGFYLVSQGDKSFWLKKDGDIKQEITDDGLTIEHNNPFGSVFVKKNLKLGLKLDGNIVLEPSDYDGISNLMAEEIYDGGNSSKSFHTSYWKLYKNGAVALYDSKAGKIVIPLEKGYTSVGAKTDGRNDALDIELLDSDLCYVQFGEEKRYQKDGWIWVDETERGLWNLKLEKEVLPPASDNDINKLPKGTLGYKSKGVAYTPTGTELKLTPQVDVYQSEWENDAPHFFTKLAGLEGRTVEFQVTIYNENGEVYTGRDGSKCIYTFDKLATPTSTIEYGPKVTAWIGSDIYVKPFSKITLKFVLSARDAKTKAPIPVKGDKTISRWYERTW